MKKETFTFLLPYTRYFHDFLQHFLRACLLVTASEKFALTAHLHSFLGIILESHFPIMRQECLETTLSSPIPTPPTPIARDQWLLTRLL